MPFSYFGLGIHFKVKKCGYSEWTFKVNIAQNTTFEGN